MPTSGTAAPSCFIAMPITTHSDEADLYGDDHHWTHVIEHLFVPAVQEAGFTPIRPAASGTSMIHGRIIQHLVEADMVLCDLSQHNPNVFFELGVRTSLNKPVALVKDEHLVIPFDTSGLNTHPYASSLDVWELPQQIQALADHLRASAREARGSNPMWRHFGVAITADRPRAEDLSPTDARLELVLERIGVIEDRIEQKGVGGGQVHQEEVQDIIATALEPLTHVITISISPQDKNRIHTIRMVTHPSTPEEQKDRTRAAIAALGEVGILASLAHSTQDQIQLRARQRKRG